MTRIAALPECSYRFGRTEIVELEDNNKKVAKLILCCGYREVDTEECIMCTGFKNVKLELRIEHFMKASKDLRFKSRKKN